MKKIIGGFDEGVDHTGELDKNCTFLGIARMSARDAKG